MENIWNLENIKKLFFRAKQAETDGRSLASVFEELASEMHCSTGSVRNYYYSQAKLFKMMPSLALEMGVETAGTRAKPFVTFDPEQARGILMRALVGKAAGKSVRATLAELSGGDEKIALRFQNKYRSLLLHHRKTVCDVMDELRKTGISFYNPYTRTIVNPGDENDIAGVLEKVEKLSGEEKELLLRKILL